MMKQRTKFTTSDLFTAIGKLPQGEILRVSYDPHRSNILLVYINTRVRTQEDRDSVQGEDITGTVITTHQTQIFQIKV